MYDEVWAVDSERVKKFFKDHPDEVTVEKLPDRSLGSMTMPQTRLMIRGDNEDELYRRFYLSFITAGG